MQTNDEETNQEERRVCSNGSCHPNTPHVHDDGRFRREKPGTFPGHSARGGAHIWVHRVHSFRASPLGTNPRGASSNAITIGHPAFPMHKASPGSTHQLDKPTVGWEFCAGHTLAGRSHWERSRKRTAEVGRTCVCICCW